MAKKQVDHSQHPLEPEYLTKVLFNYTKNPMLHMLHRTWFRNILYFMGEQWFNWSRATGNFKRIQPSRYTPTPVSNFIRDHVRSMKALILNKDFKVNVWPNSDDVEDKDAAIIAKHLIEHMDAENDEEWDDEKEVVALWTVLVGNGFDRTFPETNNYSWGMDKSGNPISKTMVVTQALSPFNLGVDTLGRRFRDKRYIGIKSLKPREWVEDSFKVLIPAGEQDQQLVNYERNLSVMVQNVSPWKGDGLETLSKYEDKEEDLVMFHEFEFKPSVKHPDGRYVAMCGNVKCFDHERMPIPVQKDGRWNYSVTDYHYHYVPGRFWSDPTVNDLISPQNTVNSIDQDLTKNRKSVGRPVLIMPNDISLKRESKAGQAFLVVTYDALTAGGQRPVIQSGTPLSQMVLEERAINQAVSQDAAGDPKNVLKGKAPTTSASGVMVDILRDAAEQGHFPDIKRWYRSLKRSYSKRLLLAEEVYKENRIIKAAGKGHSAKIRSFKSADLRGNTDVRLELGSGLASTRMGQTQMILKLTEGGFFSVNSDLDPDFRQELLKRMGLSGFKDRTNADIERAQTENHLIATTPEKNMSTEEVMGPDGETIEMKVVRNIFIAMGDPTGAVKEPIVLSHDPLFKFDNHRIHYESHRKFILSPEFREMDEINQDIMIAHTDMHKNQIELEIQKQKEEAMALAQAGQKPGGPGGPEGPQGPQGVQFPKEVVEAQSQGGPRASSNVIP
jgi:hypothetical protein